MEDILCNRAKYAPIESKYYTIKHVLMNPILTEIDTSNSRLAQLQRKKASGIREINALKAPVSC